MGPVVQGWVLYSCRAGSGQGASEFGGKTGVRRVSPAEGGGEGRSW